MLKSRKPAENMLKRRKSAEKIQGTKGESSLIKKRFVIDAKFQWQNDRPVPLQRPCEDGGPHDHV